MKEMKKLNNDTIELLRKGWKVLAIDNNPYGFNKIILLLKNK